MTLITDSADHIKQVEIKQKTNIGLLINGRLFMTQAYQGLIHFTKLYDTIPFLSKEDVLTFYNQLKR